MYHPSTELVAAAWLATLPGITSAMVASTLPKDHATWEATGFYVVTPAGGTPHPDIPIRRPLVQVDHYATKVGSQRPPHAKASTGLEDVINACWNEGDRAVDVATKAGYYGARILAVTCAREPISLYGDEQSLAKRSTDLQFHWVELPE